MTHDELGFVTVNLLTGFLGSGKTTLLRRLLAEDAFADAAVLINEFGEIGLDHHLIERIDDEIVLLRSGCVCCTVRGELADVLKDLYSKRERGLVPPFRRVIIESTGLADPFPVLSTIKADPILRHHFRPGSVVTAVDAVNGQHQLDTYIESNRQAVIADRLVITKTDLATDSERSALESRLRRINPDALLVCAGDDDLDLSSLLQDAAMMRGDHVQSPSGFYCEEPVWLTNADGAPHRAAISSVTMMVDRPIDWTAFGIWLTMLLNRHGERVLRVKGILNLVGEERPVAIHGVQHLVHTPVHMEAWPSDDRSSRLVFILDGLDGEVLKRSFEAFTLAGVVSDGVTRPRLAIPAV
ncbi:GTP-binding protein [Agrobacterium rhizogenes]|uniref:CobW family GTP-binding protein n=1 Tax=Rhizobium rhizogenes TaxID=359 RepID=UPI0004D50134|nr:GTP-binding protein [Rhizobium rhizogenes]KEA03481.1 cobalamin biosynthesis protein CobW [Rhizobium rhizogenes]MQB32859.1 GTP-binding protein [Rhizobium rhizogenes]NTF70478.1 GTP-binding protein [Rhizobium rhizogenes]NTG75907.1 GTP-binding protein [Rhizobium rhizogenes]NTG88666.1 GTP-binding protein [Rhizobium rhizogenes]